MSCVWEQVKEVRAEVSAGQHKSVIDLRYDPEFWIVRVLSCRKTTWNSRDCHKNVKINSAVFVILSFPLPRCASLPCGLTSVSFLRIRCFSMTPSATTSFTVASRRAGRSWRGPPWLLTYTTGSWSYHRVRLECVIVEDVNENAVCHKWSRTLESLNKIIIIIIVNVT